MEILDMELTPKDEKALRESLENWKEQVYADLLEEVETVKEEKVEEVNEAMIEYKEKMKEEFADRMLDALDEMKEEIRAEVLTEMYDNNPELQVFERIKELVAPTLDEDYIENQYANEIATLKEELEKYKEEKKLEEGASKLAELIAPYSERVQNIFISLIKEGDADSVTEQFYDLLESVQGLDEDEDEEEEDDDEEDDEEPDEDEEDDDEDEEDEEDEDEEDFDPYIDEDETGADDEETPKKRTLAEEIKKLAK